MCERDVCEQVVFARVVCDGGGGRRRRREEEEEAGGGGGADADGSAQPETRTHTKMWGRKTNFCASEQVFKGVYIAH